jgi:polysaccharide export outer membrane protein
MNKIRIYSCVLALLTAFVLQGCAGSANEVIMSEQEPLADESDYVIGPGDELRVFVWDNPELAVTVPVRPDGMITIPLVEDMIAVGKTPTDLARDIEMELAQYVRSPQVNIIVTNFRGTYRKQIRVVGQAVQPQSLSYQSGMTLLDVIIEVGGLTEYAAGNRAKIIRWENNRQVEIKVDVEDLIGDGDIRENLKMKPGDILIIPRSVF